MKSLLIWKILQFFFKIIDIRHYFPPKKGVYGIQASDEKIIHGLINGVKGAMYYACDCYFLVQGPFNESGWDPDPNMFFSVK